MSVGLYQRQLQSLQSTLEALQTLISPSQNTILQVRSYISQDWDRPMYCTEFTYTREGWDRPRRLTKMLGGNGPRFCHVSMSNKIITEMLQGGCSEELIQSTRQSMSTFIETYYPIQ